MRAAVWGWLGGLALEAARKVPTVGRGEVLVRVRAAAINPVDYKMGRLLGAVVGQDVAGVVERVGEGVAGLEVGDEVFGTVSGALADYAVSKADSLGRKAPGHSFVEAAAMPIVYMTGLQVQGEHDSLAPQPFLVPAGRRGAPARGQGPRHRGERGLRARGAAARQVTAEAASWEHQ
jgi:NADPH:quinone reductase-like Zn-dependent oxidoreductase